MGPLQLPPSQDSSQETSLVDAATIVIVGANGSGKSRFGAWLENHSGGDRQTHRISAQRALTFDVNVSQLPIDSARTSFLYGNSTHGKPHKDQFRWGSNPTSHVLTDYNALLSLMYALERKRDSDAIAEIRAGEVYDATRIAPSVLDTLKRIWEDAIPHRKLKSTDDALRVSTPDGEEYDGIQMSDGERVAFYLAGETLCAPENSILIVDEPEIHLHKAIQGRLWDSLESARPDCTFVYITHDLDFAADRGHAHRIWIESYDGGVWNWQHIEDSSDFPAPLVLQILGSRKPVLFVEGEDGSVDKIYRTLYPFHTIMPRGSCFSVIRTVRAFAHHDLLARHKVFGLIDRDRRTERELAALELEGIYSCPVAEIENLLCLPEALRNAAQTISAPQKADDAIALIVSEFSGAIDSHAASFAYRAVLFKQQLFAENKRWTRAELVSDYEEHVGQLDIGKMYDDEHARLTSIAEAADPVEILKVFNRKGLVNQLAGALGFKPDAYQSWLLGVLETERQTNVTVGLMAALKTYLPEVPTA